jgi:hypothetical protein
MRAYLLNKGIQMDIQTISTKIAKGVKGHLFFDGMSPDSETNDFDRGQMALSILFEFIGDKNLDQFTSEQGRNFLIECGLGSEVALRIINNDTDPLCIY